MCSTILKRSSENFIKSEGSRESSLIVEPSHFCLKVSHDVDNNLEETNTKVDLCKSTARKDMQNFSSAGFTSNGGVGA
jgi:hypothetical protein